MRKKPLALYVHIPFCVRKCAYCDFLSGPASEEIKEHYVNLLCEEIEREAVRYPGYRGTTVFFGGGTPTTLTSEQLGRILCKLSERFSVELPGKQRGRSGLQETTRIGKAEGSPGETAGPEMMGKHSKEIEEPEITLECNPGTVTGEDLRKLKAAGFNRLSIGLQSADDRELKRLGRIHTWEDFLETFRLAREAGFQNINVDLMSALPGQSVESYANTLAQVLALHAEHISAYSLIIEEGTPFYERYGKAEEQRRKDGEDKEHLLPTEEEERRMYELTEERLAREGYHRYEISNYALPGRECRHNITYWKRGDYLGLGLGAASLMENCRFTKSRDLKEYEALLRGEGRKQAAWAGGADACRETDFHQNRQILSGREQMEEFMFLGLRLMEGVSCEAFRDCFGVEMESVYGDVLRKLENQKLLARRKERVFLTKRGIDVSNVVLAEFL